MQKKIIIIGAGASGLMAAICAAEAGADVTILEQNDAPGRKILSTGNGRCNLTNTDQSADHYRGSGPGFALGALTRFSQQDTVRFFSRIGVYTVNRGGWLYPRSAQASQVRDLLVMEAKSKGVRIRCRTGVKEVTRGRRGGFDVHVEGYSYHCDSLILANGSRASVPEEAGCSGYRIAASFGHRIVEPLPALVPLVTREKYGWHGVRTEGKAVLFVDSFHTAESSGELQLTSYGISGIPIFEISRYAARALAGQKSVSLEIDFFPDFDLEGLRHFFEGRSIACPFKNTPELMCGLFPDKLIQVFSRFRDPLPAIKCFPLTVIGTKGFDQAQVCSGGVSTMEVNPFTMESRICRNLYFAGEILDIDGTCGGYNLQWAWSSGAAAGKSAAEASQEAS